MATFGEIEEFSDSDDWGQYIERLENYFEANEIRLGVEYIQM